jgi:hypothetical protein
VWLASGEVGAVHHLDRHAVGRRARGQRFERGDLPGGRGDDELAAARVRDVVAGGEVVEAFAAFDAQGRLERVGGVVDAGVNDAAVAGAGLVAEARMLLQQTDREPRLRDRQRAGQAGDASTHDSHIDVGHRWLSSPFAARDGKPPLTYYTALAARVA